MHRTIRVPRLAACWSFLAGLALHAGAHSATAQDFQLPTPAPQFQVQPAAPVAPVAAAPVAAAPVAAPQGQPAFAVAAQPGIDEPKATERLLTVPFNTTKVVGLTNREILESVANESGKIVKVQSIVDDPRNVLVTGLAVGSSRLTLKSKESKTVEFVVVRVADESEAILEAKRKDLQEMIRRSVPTANVEVTLIGATTPGGAVTVVLSGTVSAPESVQIILAAAASIFPGPQSSGTSSTGASSVSVTSQTSINIVNNIRLGGVQQVQLEVLVAVVNRSELRQMSFSWVENGQKQFLTSVLSGPLGITNALATSVAGATNSLTNAGPANITFGVLGNKSSFNGFLQALRTEKLAKVLAEPRVVTLSGRPAFIISGGETPILTSSGQGAPSVSYKQFGTVVNFLPIVLGNGKIHLEVRPELSDKDDSLGISVGGITPTIVPGFTTRSAQVAVQIEDGQTLAIGGLIQNKINASVQKVPILGDLPFLGTLFTNKAYEEREEELLILVTPRLVDGIDCTKFPKYLPGRETRSPDDFELFLEGILEAPRGQRTINFPHGYQGAHKSATNGAGLYPCNDAFGVTHGRGGCVNCGGVGCGLPGCGQAGCSSGGCANGACAPSVFPTLAPANGLLSTSPALGGTPRTLDSIGSPLPKAAPSSALPALPTNPAPATRAPATSAPATPASVAPNSGIPPMPPVSRGDTTPGLAPAAPFAPARELETRPVLPPVSFLPANGGGN
jgi:pilus assembly protein CpaC